MAFCLIYAISHNNTDFYGIPKNIAWPVIFGLITICYIVLLVGVISENKIQQFKHLEIIPFVLLEKSEAVNLGIIIIYSAAIFF